ncbi:hypothetical protein EDC30_101526 [Paucimonas lemoignei]|uniref:Ceramidase n=1 Tax=Paucimonas lemoignei TaxID=29443 RepID=A0A4V6NY18_PAULE|nr:alkaline phytoceramidase [Paucimonas lemoignei]TCS39570.1 hypothetical protein EDC30_101526 [Paucimonas lemoignei]
MSHHTTPYPAQEGAMPSQRHILPIAIVLITALAMLWHGPINQLSDYHNFADQRTWLGIEHAADVLSNLGFAAVAAYGLLILRRQEAHPAFAAGIAGYRLFFGALALTALGSSWYHLAPDNASLVFDRLPIALACAGLLAAVWRETLGSPRWLVWLLGAAAIVSVAWWRLTDLEGAGDLRPYLLLQLLPLILVPLLQHLADRPRQERLMFASAIGLYVLAKLCELADWQMLDALALISGHTLKHVLASLAALIVARQLASRVRHAGSSIPHPQAK